MLKKGNTISSTSSGANKTLPNIVSHISQELSFWEDHKALNEHMKTQQKDLGVNRERQWYFSVLATFTIQFFATVNTIK